MKAKQIHLATWANQVNYCNRICNMSLNELEHAGFDISYENHAKAILNADFRNQINELKKILLNFEIFDYELLKKGGGQTSIVTRLSNKFKDISWSEKKFKITKTLDGEETVSTTHRVDHVLQSKLGNIALEIEWSTKDLSFDRDLENFRKLHAENAISVGIIITRGKSLQDNIENIIMKLIQKNNIKNLTQLRNKFELNLVDNQKSKIKSNISGRDFAKNCAQVITSSKFGTSTSHWKKLDERIQRGVGSPCPLCLIGIPDSVVRETDS